MNTNWEQVKELVNSALDRSPEERESFLRQACGTDASLLLEVESLLSSYESETSSALPGSGLTGAGGFASEKIGPYDVIRQIGSGGMGTVYLAMRSDDAFRKRVAIKVVAPSVDAQDVSRRFQRERQILAALDYPCIARLFDGGTTKAGLPYFVMEYVEGVRIDQYCDRHRLSIAERIKLFRQVCSAVQYVHQNLIVHRDLKPGNILVTADGVPKLLDFGIAKVLKPELFANSADVTRADFQVMTPFYASPEQVRGDPINVSSDVYSLGVILFEILTSRRPYRLRKNSQHEILTAICNQEPEKPSTAISRMQSDFDQERNPSETLESLAKVRATIPQKLQRQLRGELDNIVLKTLRKEPQHRYASVEQFSEDLRRYLEGLPVRAYRDTWSYRSSKFIIRHKGVVAAATLVFVSLLAGVLGTAWQASIARERRAEAQRNFNDVRRLATSFLFEIHTAIQDLPGSTPARQLVVQRALEYLRRLSQESHNDPGLQRELAEAYLKVGDVQGNPYSSNLGDAAGAAASYTKALAISNSLLASNPQDNVARLYLARSYKLLGQVLPVLGRPTEAAANLRSAADLFERLAKADPNNQDLQNELAQCYQVLGDTLGHGGMQNLGDPSGALAAYQRALAINEQLAASHPEDQSARNGIPFLQIRIGDLEHDADHLAISLNYYRQALEALADHSNSTKPEDQWLLALAYRKVGVVQDNMGSNSQALKSYLKAADIDQQQVNVDPLNVRASMSLAISLRYAGELMEKTGNLQAAIGYNRRIIQIFEKLSAANSNNIVLRGRYAEILIATGGELATTHQMPEGRRMSSRGLALDRQLAKREDVTSDDLAQYALDFLTCEPADLRDSAAAKRFAEQSVAKAENSYNLDVLAQAYFQNGNRSQAIATEEKALSQIPPTPSGASVSPLRNKIEARLASFRAASSPANLSAATSTR
ncbi:MAG: protein kinase [Acidobacteria bacterium]|nr:protein kinase [Acidobacteriota bacterium]